MQPYYSKMYAILCSAASAALDALPDNAENKQGRDILQFALYEAEEVYLRATSDTMEADS